MIKPEKMEDKEKRFASILKGNQERILRICAYHTNDKDDCKDLYQQVLINIWQSLGSFRGEANINTWLYRVALNTAIDFTRSENRRKQVALKYFDEYHSLKINLCTSWEKIRLEKMMDEMWRQINLLSIIDKVIMTLVLEDLSSREIAEIVGISDTSVRVKIHRIKENLKTKIGDQSHE
jgi:RNA polymerase sigma-70 factor (ECF subfamily)